MLELVSFDELKLKLGGRGGLSGTVLADNPRLEIIVESVYAAIESYIRRILEQGAYTKTYYPQEFGQGRYNTVDLSSYLHQHTSSYLRYPVTIGIPALPIVSIASVEDGDANELRYKEKRYGVLVESQSADKIVVDYTGGYLQAEIPSAIKRAALYQIQSEWLRRDHPDADYQSVEGGSITRPEFGLLEEIKRLLNPFRHPFSLGV